MDGFEKREMIGDVYYTDKRWKKVEKLRKQGKQSEANHLVFEIRKDYGCKCMIYKDERRDHMKNEVNQGESNGYDWISIDRPPVNNTDHGRYFVVLTTSNMRFVAWLDEDGNFETYQRDGGRHTIYNAWGYIELPKSPSQQVLNELAHKRAKEEHNKRTI